MTRAPEFVGEHTLGRSGATGGDLVAFVLPETNEQVTYRSDEVMSFCPVTGQPDFYEVEINAYKSPLGLESKSLKMYLQKFNDKDQAQFCEAFAERICIDAWRAMTQGDGEMANTPESVQVTVIQRPRGGVSITATSHIHV